MRIESHDWIEIVRRVTQTFENKTGNFYCSRQCYYKALNEDGLALQERLHTKYQILKHQALAKISTEGHCINCGCDLVGILDGNTVNFLKDIISGNRKTDDLEIAKPIL